MWSVNQAQNAGSPQSHIILWSVKSILLLEEIPFYLSGSSYRVGLKKRSAQGRVRRLFDTVSMRAGLLRGSEQARYLVPLTRRQLENKVCGCYVEGGGSCSSCGRLRLVPPLAGTTRSALRYSKLIVQALQRE